MLLSGSRDSMNSTVQAEKGMDDTSLGVNIDIYESDMTSDDVRIATLDFGMTSSSSRRVVLLSFDWIVTVTIILIMVLTLVGNILMIYFICSQKKSRTAQNISIVSLSVATILTASFVIPAHLVIATYDADENDETAMFLCKLQMYVWYWCKTVIIYSICALICDRYSRATQPTKSHMLSGRYMFFLSFVWFFGAAYNIWDIIIELSDYVTVTAPDGQNATLRRCVTSAQFSHIQGGLIYSDMLIIYVIPLVAIIYMYGGIIYYRYCKSMDCQRAPLNHKKMFLSVALTVTFYVCQLPVEVMEAWGFFAGTESFKLVLVKKITEVVSFSHGLLSILVYLAFSSELHGVLWRKCLGSASRSYRRVNSANTPQIRVNGDDTSHNHSNGQDTSLEMSVIVTQGQV